MLATFGTGLTMEPHILISRIKSLLAAAPSFETYSPASYEHQAWLAKAHALVAQWNANEASSVKRAANYLSLSKDMNLAQIFGALHRAVADLELKLPDNAGQAFGPGAVYDFFKELNALMASASSSLFVVDRYIDDTIFDAYLSSAPKEVRVRLLAHNTSANLKQAIEKFTAQHGITIEARASHAFHDRVVFVDGADCWVLGQSIKDAAKSMPTYLAPLSFDVAAEKFADYENIWDKATAI